MKKYLPLILTMLFIVALGATALSATKTASVTGAWNVTATWGGSAVPAATDVVIINDGITVTITAAATCAGVTINSGGILTTTTFGLTVAGTWVNNGTFNAGTGTVTFSGTTAAINVGTGTGNFYAISLPTTGTNTLTINTSVVCATFSMPQNTSGSNTINISGTNTLTVLGLVIINRIAAFNVNAGTLIADSIDMTGGTASHVASLNITTGTVTVLGNIAFSGDITTIQKIIMGSGTLNIGGNLGADGTFNAGTGTVNFDGTSAQTIGAYTYNNLTIDNSAGATVASPGITVNGILNLQAGAVNNTNPITLNGTSQSEGGYTTSPLPVEMTSFTADAQSTSALLKWSTATEVNNYGFDIERRTVRSSTWAKVGFVAGNGTSNATHNYTYADNDLSAGKYAYRLKQIDNGGAFKYSQSIELEVSLVPATIGLSQNYPNPFNPSTKITFALASTEYAKLVVYNLLGQQLETLFNGIADGQKEYVVTFDASQLASGIYFYKMQTATRTDVRRMMLMK